MIRIALLTLMLIASSAAGLYLYRGLYGSADSAAPAAMPTSAQVAGLPPPAEPAAPVTRVPPFALLDMDGQPRTSTEWEGRPLLINFWATWCPPCRDEMPLLIELQNEFETIDLQVIGIAVDDPAPVRRFAEQIGVNYPLLVGEQQSLDVAESLGLDVVALPISVFTDASGTIVKIHRGELHRDEAVAILQAL